jgi:soluble lytic murein transglycosylase
MVMQETADYRIRGDESRVSELLTKRKFKEARRLATKLAAREDLEQQPRSKLILQKAMSELALGRPEQAYADLHKIEGTLELLADHLSFWMAQALENMGERHGAISAYEDFLMRSEHRALKDSVSLRLATLYAKHQSFERPLELYEETVQRSPHLIPEALFLMGQTLEADESRKAAREKWRQLIASYPAHPRALQAVWKLPARSGPQGTYRTAIVYYRHGQHRRAARAFRQFLAQYPRHELAREAEYQLGRSYLAARQYGKAEKTFSKAYLKHRIPAALYRLAGIQVRRNKDQKSTRTYEEFADSYPQHELAPRALWQAAKAAERNNLFADAQRFYAAIVERYPKSEYREPAAWSVGFMRYCQDEYREAMELFGELAQSLREPHLVDQSFYWAGKSAERLKLKQRAQRYFVKAAAGFPRSYYSARALSQGYSNPTRVKPRMELRAPPEDTAGIERIDFLQRADLLHELGLGQLAVAELREVERINKNNTAALRVIRDRYEHFGLLDRALVMATRIANEDSSESTLSHLYPDYYWKEVVKASREADLDPYLILAVIRQESFFNEDAVSRAGARGLMQIMPQTGRRLARSMGLRRFESRTLFDPSVSIRMGSRFLGDQVRAFDEGPTSGMGFQLGLAAYNAGPHVARKWINRFPLEDTDTFVERIPYRETRLYVKKILKNYTIYKALANV